MATKTTEKEFLSAYEAYADSVFRFCYFKMSDRELAKDAVQEVFLRFWEYRLGGKEVKNVRPFLFTIASNYIKDHWKKKRPVPLSSFIKDDSDDTVFEVADTSEDLMVPEIEYDLAIKLFTELSDDDRTILHMRFVDDLAVKDISKELGERENTISVRIGRALGRLKEKFEKTIT